MLNKTETEKDLPVLRRLWIYQRERIPLLKTATLLAVFSAASVNVSALLAERPLPGWDQLWRVGVKPHAAGARRVSTLGEEIAMRIAIVTPTGNIGRPLVHELLEQGGHELVLLARDPSKLTDEQARGATVAQGDLTDEAFVTQATAGADALFWLCPPAFYVPDYRAHYNELSRAGAAAVKANAIPHTVFLSSVGAHLPDGTGPIAGLHDGEKIFAEATQGLTILRPGFFMENFLYQLDTIKQAGSIFMPVRGEATLPMIATADIAERAAQVLTSPAPTSPTIVALHGPKDLSLAEAAKIIAERSGRDVQHVQVEPAQARESFIQMGMSEGVADTMLEMYAAFDAGTVVDDVPRSPETTTPTTMEAFVDGVLGPAIQG